MIIQPTFTTASPKTIICVEDAIHVVQKPIKARTTKARPVSGIHIRTAASDIFRALVSIDLSEKITLIVWRGKAKHTTRLVT